MKPFKNWFWPVSFGLTVAIVFSNCNSCNPGSSNIGYICTFDISGSTYSFQTAPGGVSPVNFIARVYYATLDTTCTQPIDTSRHPLVIFGHGRFGNGAGSPNYLGATNLMNHLASWGYICVSVNLDVVSQLNSSSNQWGIPHRGELLLHAIEYMIAANNDPNSIFYNRIDTTKIALIGHSRGGGGATYAVNLNASKSAPRQIKALATISPTNFGTTPIGGQIPQLMIFGTWDGDLSDGQGYTLWDPVNRDSPRVFVEAYGANHFHFTDAINYPGELNEISRSLHHKISKGFINAFFDLYLKGLDRYDWPKYLRGEIAMVPKDSAKVFLQFLNSGSLVVDNGTPPLTPNVNNLGQANNGTTLALFDDRTLNNPSENQFGNTDALRASWASTNQFLVFSLGGRGVASYSHLAFRSSQRHGQSQNAIDQNKNWTIRLLDTGGNSASVPLINYVDGLKYPDLAQYPPGHGSIGTTRERKNIPETFRIPLAHFSGVNLHSLDRIEFRFNLANQSVGGINYDNDSGAITIDDIEFTN